MEAGFNGLYIREITLKIYIIHHQNNYTVSQKKTSPTFLSITQESIDGFL